MAAAKTSDPAEMRLGVSSGSVMRVNTRNRPAPAIRADSSRAGSIFSRPEANVSRARGISNNTITHTSPAKV